MISNTIESVDLPRQEAEKLFYSCWDSLVSRLEKQLTKHSVVPERKSCEIDEIEVDGIRDEIRNILRESLLKHGEQYEIYLAVYEQIFHDLILPASKHHHRIATAMLTPSIMTFEMLNCFMDSWIKDSYFFLADTQFPDIEIQAAIDNYMLGLGLDFDIELVKALCADKTKKFKVLQKLPRKSEQFVRFYFEPTARPQLIPFLADQLMGEVCDELTQNMMRVEVEVGSQYNKNPVFRHYQKTQGLKADDLRVKAAAYFFESYKAVILENPYIGLEECITIRIKGKKAEENDLPFGLMGLMALKAMLSTVLLTYPNTNRDCAITMTVFEEDKTNYHLQGYVTHLQFNIEISGLLPFIKNEQFVRFALKPHLEAVCHLYQIKDLDFDGLLKFASSYMRFTSAEGFSNNPLEGTLLNSDEVYTASSGELFN